MEPPIFTFIKSERHSTFVDLIYESGQFGACGSSFFVDSDIGFLTESTNLFFNKIPISIWLNLAGLLSHSHTHTHVRKGALILQYEALSHVRTMTSKWPKTHSSPRTLESEGAIVRMTP
jgi:hypothetical protein